VCVGKWGGREKTPMAERGSMVFQREGRPTWFQRVAASLSFSLG